MKIFGAIRDLRFLLDRGYPRASAVNFVSNHYRLPAKDRHLLTRCVFSGQEVRRHQAKAVGKTAVKGKKLGVDGYNVLITVEGILLGRKLIRCDDGFIRDLRAIFGKYRMSSAASRALRVILDEILEAKPQEAVLMFDKQVSRSGELAALARTMLNQRGIKGGAKAVSGVDLKLGNFEVVASSDRAVIEKARAVWDIPAEVLKKRRAKFLDLTKV